MARASQVDGVLQKVTTVADRVLRAGGSLSFHLSGVSLGRRMRENPCLDIRGS